MTGLNEFVALHDLTAVEVYQTAYRPGWVAVRNSMKRPIRDNLYGSGDTPEAALSDLFQKCASLRAAPKLADPLDDLLG